LCGRETIKFPQPERWGKLCLQNGIFRKYPFDSLITSNIDLYLEVDVCIHIRKEFHGHETPSFSSGSVYLLTYDVHVTSWDWQKRRNGTRQIGKNVKTPLQRVKRANFFGKYHGGTTFFANSPWLLDNREICLKYTCNGSIKTKYFYIRCNYVTNLINLPDKYFITSAKYFICHCWSEDWKLIDLCLFRQL
jgi:hypothetical protein